jgi:nicotinate phosphoribosyltransferase
MTDDAPDIGNSLLLTDLYQLNMYQAYLDHGMGETAVFEFFVRKLPEHRGFLMAAGLEQAVTFLESARFGAAELEWLRASGRFRPDMIELLSRWRFRGDVDAMPEGTIFFSNEPILRIVAPLPDAQLVETRLINLLHFQTVVASKATRFVLAAQGRGLTDFGLRRAHGAEAGLLAARASYIAGFDSTATTLAGLMFGVPIAGTMAHSFVQAHDSEEEAFERFASSRPDQVTLLIDTYDTPAAARKVVALAPRLAAKGIGVAAVRIDSGDLAALSRQVRGILDAGGLPHVRIVVSGGLDEHDVRRLLAANVPIDAFGIGTSLTTSSDAPALDCAYKLQEYAGIARRKRSAGKETWPGRKQVWRRFGADGTMIKDGLSLATDHVAGTPLLRPILRAGRRVEALPTMAEIRARAAQSLRALPAPLSRLEDGFVYPVDVMPPLRQLAAECDRRAAPVQG